MTDQIRSLADLRPGDIMCGPIGGLVPGVFPVGVGQLLLGEVFRAGRLSVRHVGIVVQAGVRHPGWTNPRLVQAMPSGAEMIELTEAEHWTPRHAYLRLPEDYPGQADDAAAIARLMVEVGTPYSFASYASLVLWRWGVRVDRLERWINRRRDVRVGPDSIGRTVTYSLPVEAICSVLVDQAWTLAHKDVMPNTAEQAVTPGALAGQLWRTPGVIWGLP
jgi:hypothetical protein